MSTDLYESFDGMHKHPLGNSRTLSKLVSLEEQYYNRQLTPNSLADLVVLYGVGSSH